MNNELNQIWTVLPKIYIFGLELGGPWHSGAPGHCPPCPPYCYATAIEYAKLVCISVKLANKCAEANVRIQK